MAIGLMGWEQGCWEAWFPLLVFSPFILDASVTLGGRTVAGKSITEAHRDHYYQRAVLMGWSHKQIALAEYALMFFLGLTAIMNLGQAEPWVMLAVWGLIYSALLIWLEHRWRHMKPATLSA